MHREIKIYQGYCSCHKTMLSHINITGYEMIKYSSLYHQKVPEVVTA